MYGIISLNAVEANSNQREAGRTSLVMVPQLDEQYHLASRQQQLEYRHALDQQIAQIQEERQRQKVLLWLCSILLC